MDTTVVEAKIHYPTDTQLLYDNIIQLFTETLRL